MSFTSRLQEATSRNKRPITISEDLEAAAGKMAANAGKKPGTPEYEALKKKFLAAAKKKQGGKEESVNEAKPAVPNKNKEKRVADGIAKKGYKFAIVFSSGKDPLYTKSQQQAIDLMRDDYKDEKDYKILPLDKFKAEFLEVEEGKIPPQFLANVKKKKADSKKGKDDDEDDEDDDEGEDKKKKKKKEESVNEAAIPPIFKRLGSMLRKAADEVENEIKKFEQGKMAVADPMKELLSKRLPIALKDATMALRIAKRKGVDLGEAELESDDDYSQRLDSAAETMTLRTGKEKGTPEFDATKEKFLNSMFKRKPKEESVTKLDLQDMIEAVQEGHDPREVVESMYCIPVMRVDDDGSMEYAMDDDDDDDYENEVEDDFSDDMDAAYGNSYESHLGEKSKAKAKDGDTADHYGYKKKHPGGKVDKKGEYMIIKKKDGKGAADGRVLDRKLAGFIMNRGKK